MPQLFQHVFGLVIGSLIMKRSFRKFVRKPGSRSVSTDQQQVLEFENPTPKFIDVILEGNGNCTFGINSLQAASGKPSLAKLKRLVSLSFDVPMEYVSLIFTEMMRNKQTTIHGDEDLFDVITACEGKGETVALELKSLKAPISMLPEGACRSHLLCCVV